MRRPMRRQEFPLTSYALWSVRIDDDTSRRGDLCRVNVSNERPDLVWVTEAQGSSAAHRASLALPWVREAIAEAIPVLTGEFESAEFEVVGGLGLPLKG